MIIQLISLLILATVRNVNCCGGYTFSLSELETCSDDSLVQVDEGNSYEINTDCEGSGDICYTVDKDITEGTGTITVLSKIITYIPVKTVDVDVCDPSKDDDLAALMRQIIYPDGCPIKKREGCEKSSAKIVLGELEGLLPLASDEFQLKLEVETPDGDICILIHLTKTSTRRAAARFLRRIQTHSSRRKDMRRHHN